MSRESVIEPGSTRAGIYVGLTRGRGHNTAMVLEEHPPQAEGCVMQALFVNFNVPGKSIEGVVELLEPLVPAFSELPGLLAKTWLANADDDRYGALYLWRDQEALDNFLASDLWKSVASHPSLANFDVRPFAVVEDFTKATQPGMVAV